MHYISLGLTSVCALCFTWQELPELAHQSFEDDDMTFPRQCEHISFEQAILHWQYTTGICLKMKMQGSV